MLSLLAAVALATPGGLTAEEGELVLVHTDVLARVQADLAVVDVTQTFENPFAEPIDATYVFPLPVHAAVRDLTVTCGERVIGADILRKEEARARYEAARAEGRRAALLEQQRPNLFTQQVAGLCPGETVEVTLQYVEPLEVSDGIHRFVFPTTTAPHFEPGDRVEPPMATEPLGRGLDVRVEVDAGLPLQSIGSDSHPFAVVGEDDRGADIELLEGLAVADRDVDIWWTLGAATPQVAALTATDARGERYLSLSVEPPAAEVPVDARPRELVFVLDSSCSMSGEPWQAAVDTVQLALDRLRPEESFNLVRFSDAAGRAFPQPVPATEANVATAAAWMRRFEGGGTGMTAGIVDALEQPGDPEALRMVLLLTDGYIGQERQVFRTVRDHLGEGDRIFALGIGASVNRFLLDGVAAEGRGDALHQLPDTPMIETVRGFYRRIDRPVLTDLSVDWGPLDAVGDGLDAPPDVFTGHPIHLVARVDGAEAGVVTLNGRVGGRPWSQQVVVDLADAVPHEAVPTLWARRRIAALARDLDADPDATREAITALALDHHLVSDHTSLVAVDRNPGACGAGTATHDVPSQLPAGVDAQLARNSGVLGVIGGSATGMGGLGTRGSGLGGGGSAAGLGKSGYGVGGGTFGSKGAAGSVDLSVPVVTGSLDRSLIRRTVQRHLGALRYCYERALAKDPTLSGKVVARLVIGPDGTVTDARADEGSTLNDPEVQRCLIGRFQRMTFPAPRSTIVVTYPVVFHPSE